MLLTRKWVLVGVLLCSGLAKTPETTLRGVLYSDHGGPSATGTGDIGLVVAEKKYRIHYQKPYPQFFSTPACRDIGALWSVVVTMETATEGELHRATCRETFDQSIHGPWLTVRSFLAELRAGWSRRSERALTSQLRQSASFGPLLDKLRLLDTSNYRKYGNEGRCLDATGTLGPAATYIHAGMGCYLRLQGDPVIVTFTVILIRDSGRWEINGIQFRKPTQDQD